MSCYRVELFDEHHPVVVELTPFRDAMAAALAEAGHPHAKLTIGPFGVFVEGAPTEVIAKAFEVCRGITGDPK